MRFDLIFVDADHGYAGVKKDTELALSFANEGCLFVLHDSLVFEGVARWTSELKQGRIPALQHRSSLGKRLGLEVFQYHRVNDSPESSAHRTFKFDQAGRSHRQSGVERVAVIFDNTVRPDTTGIYCRRALEILSRSTTSFHHK